MVVWRAPTDGGQHLGICWHSKGNRVTALAIERTPWGQNLENTAVRLASCSDVGQVRRRAAVRLLPLHLMYTIHVA